MIDEMLTYGKPEKIVFFEDVVEKSWRKWRASETPFNHHNLVKDELRKFNLLDTGWNYVKHHRAHAAGGFYTSGYKDALIMSIDSF